jgi:UDP-N-acetylglucosamine--N-acetylmuramyl-(pentapeptide) pyrophosphoryl-undecaprenol N-acetylglucosamine transferase
LRVLIAGGGTGGHVIPALAIARELRDRCASQVRFVGTARGLETKLVPEAGFALELIHVGQLKGVSLMTRVRTLADLPLGLLRCASLIRRFKPDVVVGVGGYASGPAMGAAVLLRVPTVAFEPNAVPGLANRLVGKYVSAAAVNFPLTKAYFRNARVTGIPVRAEFFAVEPKTTGSRRLLVFGGSQGARVLNEVMPAVAAELLKRFPDLTIVHQAGGKHGESTTAAYAVTGVDFSRVRVQPYLDGMVAEIAVADLILCRGGARPVCGSRGRPSEEECRCAGRGWRRRADRRGGVDRGTCAEGAIRVALGRGSEEDHGGMRQDPGSSGCRRADRPDDLEISSSFVADCVSIPVLE